MHRIRGKFTYANVVSTLCLILLVGGGTAFAASQLAKESVGTKELAKGAVTPSKLSKSSKKAMVGERGAAGAQGAPGPKGDKGEKGDRGEAGPPGPFADTLPSGKTLKGDWADSFQGEEAETAFSFGIPLAQPLQASKVHFIDLGAPVPSGCSGSPENPGAAPGNLCVFVGNAVNFKFSGSCVVEPSVDYNCLNGPVGEGFGTTGAAIYLRPSGPNVGTNVGGTWAVTAP